MCFFPNLGAVSRNSRKLFGSEKPFVKLRPAYSVKLVFSYVVKGMKFKITAKFRASRRLRFKDTRRIMSPEMRPKSFGTFEKWAPEQPKTKRYHDKYLHAVANLEPRSYAGKERERQGFWQISVTYFFS